MIGYAGDTGGGNMIVGRVHLHTAFYRYPKDNPDGSPYGAQGCRSPSTITSAPRRQGIKVDARVYDYAKATPRRFSAARE